MAKVTERFFYTTHTPHEWSGGPSVHYGYYDDDKKYKEIKDIDEARLAAKRATRGTPGYSGFVRTTYGVTFEEEWEND